MKTLADASRCHIFGFVYDAKKVDHEPDNVVDSYQMSGGWILFVTSDKKLFRFRK